LYAPKSTYDFGPDVVVPIPHAKAAASAPSTTHSNSTVVAFELQQASNVPLSTAEIKKKPWKYLGYKTFASWMSLRARERIKRIG
jgi:hypothetical protein